MVYRATVRQERFTFDDLPSLLAKANEAKSGDALAGIAATSERERVAAKLALAEVSLAHLVENPVVDPTVDDVSRLILDTLDQQVFAEIASLTVGEFREYLLTVDGEELQRLAPGISPEIAAATCKLMGNRDLATVAAKIRNVTRLRNTLGESGVLASRIQPNHPSDDVAGIILSAIEGLTFGCGDAVIGVNPATDSVDAVGAILDALRQLVDRLEIPTQTCCLAHITTQLACLERGHPVDLLFQSIAGTQKANASFGVTLDMLRQGRAQVIEHHRARGDRFVGQDVMYFETGQGSALSADAHHGVDQLTLEARAYGVARTLGPLLVNTVVGFIGPEYLYDERQIIRAGLEDHFMGKLLGLPMGCDVCYTNHADADQNSADNLLMLLAAAGCNYFMGVPCADDVMLNYQSTSYHDVASVREWLRLRPAPEFAAWLERWGIHRDGRLTGPDETLARKLLAPVERSLA